MHILYFAVSRCALQTNKQNILFSDMDNDTNELFLASFQYRENKEEMQNME